MEGPSSPSSGSEVKQHQFATRIPGQRGAKIAFNGFCYTFSKRCKTFESWYCEQRRHHGCPGRIRIAPSAGAGSLQVLGVDDHNHGRDDALVETRTVESGDDACAGGAKGGSW